MPIAPKMPTLLIVDDEPTIREALSSALEEEGYVVRAAEGVSEARRLVDGADAVLLDIRLRDGDGLELLGELRASNPTLPVIMATSYGDSDRTIRAMKLGAFEYVTKPFELDALFATIARAVKPPAAAAAPTRGDAHATLIGASPRMREVWKAIGRAAGSDAPVLITGESGTGKELVARAIHDHSARAAAPFVPLNLAAVPATLVESELFGHEKGAFTGAAARREGRFELAGDGTLFLDEIGDLELSLQTKLLRVLEDGGFERVGGATRLVSRARVLAATSRPVQPRSEGATLREDLFYRLSVVRIEVPPLRERRDDIPLLVDAFLQQKSGKRRAVSRDALSSLCAYDWPGNVRELRHVLERACVMSGSEVLDASELDLPAAPAPTDAAPLAGDLDLKAARDRLERSMIEEALRRASGNRAEAARLLGIRRALLYTRLRHFGLISSDERDDE